MESLSEFGPLIKERRATSDLSNESSQSYRQFKRAMENSTDEGNHSTDKGNHSIEGKHSIDEGKHSTDERKTQY